MSSRDNFRQAARELFGLETKKGKEGDAPPSVEGFLSELPEEDTAAEPVSEPAEQEQPPQSSAAPPVSDASAVAHGTAYTQQHSSFSGYEGYTPPASVGYTPPPAAESYTPPQQSHVPPQSYAPQQAGFGPTPPAVQQASQEYSIVDTRRETSIIAKGTTVVGRVRTDGHIEVMGRVEGNIDAEGNVAVSGRVAGNVKGQHLELLSCQIKGNLTAGAGVFVNSETVIVGDIAAENVIFDGRIKGNVEAAQSAEFNRNSYIVGDISAKTIAIEPGAVINGMIRTLGDQFDDGDFDELGKF